MTKKTLVLGGSLNPDRYANKAIHRLVKYGHPVVSIGLRAGEVAGVTIETGKPDYSGIDTVTIYLNPFNQEPFFEYILELKPRRVIFNPGTENNYFARQCREAGIEVVEHCTLIMLDAGDY